MTKFRVICGLMALGCLYVIIAYPNQEQAPHNALFFIMGAALIGVAPAVKGFWLVGLVLVVIGWGYPLVM